MNHSQPLCPCGMQLEYHRLPYALCCQPYHEGKLAQTPEQLMRSRYSAFVLKKHDYLIATHAPSYLNGLTASMLDSDNHSHWLGLTINSSQISGERGCVEFHAWYHQDGLDAIHEVSQFIKQDGVWRYTTGKQLKTQLPKRNDPCICHSGKKFKQCCSKYAT